MKEPREVRGVRALVWPVLAACAALPPLALAEPVADPAGGHAPRIDTTANGLPLVQITTPSAAGVSHNQYQRFDVDPQGLILNNSRVITPTQQAGYVDGNPNLVNGTARIILNEVTSTYASALRGYAEVAGDRAEVVIANPNGITCNGCGFLNTARGVLTTGTPVFGPGGSLDALRVTGGQIAFEGAGLNAAPRTVDGALDPSATVDRLDVLSRAVALNAKVWAKELNVVTGANEIGYADLGTRAIDATDERPAVSLDVSSFGGMYADRIRLIGTEAGLGVASAGEIIGDAVQIDQAGRVVLSGATRAKTLDLAAQGVDNQAGALIAGGAVGIATDDLNNAGRIDGDTLAVKAKTLTNTATLVGDTVTLEARELTNHGATALIGATERLDLYVRDALENRAGASLYSLGTLAMAASDVRDERGGHLVRTREVLNESATIEAEGDITLAAERLIDRLPATTIDIMRDDFLQPHTEAVPPPWGYEAARREYTQTDQIVTVSTVSEAGRILSGANLTLRASVLENDKGLIVAGGDIDLQADQFRNLALASTHTTTRQGTDYLGKTERRCVNGGFYECNHKNVWAEYPVPYAPPSTTVLTGGLPAVVSAGGSLHAEVGTFSNTVSDADGKVWSATASVESEAAVAASATPTELDAMQLLQDKRSGSPITRSGLYTVHTAPGLPLFTVDERFTNYRTFLSSDYMLSRLGLDMPAIPKRLGDGFVEQQRLRDQLMQLAGRPLLEGYVNAEEQFRALMEEGIASAERLELVPGLALTEAQMASLTHDIVWMVEQPIERPDGQTERVLAPVVYLTRAKPKDVWPSGLILAGESISLKSNGTLANSGQIKGGLDVILGAERLINDGGIIESDANTTLEAQTDIVNRSGRIRGEQVALDAGGNILHTTAAETVTTSDANGETAATRVGARGLIEAHGDVDISAGGDITLAGADLKAGADLSLATGNNLSVGAVAQQARVAVVFGQDYYTRDTTTHIASTLEAGGNLVLQAADEARLEGVQARAQNALTLSAAEVTVTAVKNSALLDVRASYGQGNYARTRTEDETVIGSHLQASGPIAIHAGPAGVSKPSESAETGHVATAHDILIEGSALTSDHGAVRLAATGDVTIQEAREQHRRDEQHYQKDRSLVSTKTTETHDTFDQNLAVGSRLKGDSVRITSGHDIGILGSAVDAEHDIDIGAMNDINIAAATSTYSSEHARHETRTGLRVANIFDISNKGPETTGQSRTDGTQHSRSRLASHSGNLNVIAGGNLIAGGTDLTAQGDLALTAAGAVILPAGQDTLSQSQRTATRTRPNLLSQQRSAVTDAYDSTTHQGSTLQAGKITVNSGANIILQATRLTAGDGGIHLDADGDIQLLAATDSTRRQHHETLRTDGLSFRWDASVDDLSDRRKDHDTEQQTQTAQVTQLNSAGDITSRSGGNTLVGASLLDAEGRIGLIAGYDAEGGILNPDATLTFAAVKDSAYAAESERSNSLLWQSQSGQGDYTETVKLAHLSAGQGLTANAAGGMIVEIPEVPAEPAMAAPANPAAGHPGTDPDTAGRAAPPPPTPEQRAQAAADQKHRAAQRLDEHIDRLARQPGQAWIGQLASLAKDQPDSVKLQQVNAALQHWDYAHEGLTPEAAVVIAIVVTYFTAGTASEAAAGLVASAGATGATAAVASAALAAGMVTLASQAAVTLINNQGNVGQTLKDLGKRENIRALVTAMVTAGVLQGLNTTLGLQNVNAQSSFTDQLQKNLINQSSSAVVNHALNGGDFQQQLERSLKNAFIDTGAAQGADWIGDRNFDTFSNKFAHAIAGCAAGAAKAGDCSSGALGAVVGELSAELYGGNRTNARNLDLPAFNTDTVNFARMMAGIAAVMTGNDVNVAAQAGENAAENNYLSHWQQAVFDKEMKACHTYFCKLGTMMRWGGTSVKQDAALVSGMALGATFEVKDMATALTKLPGTLKEIANNPELLKHLPAGYVQDLEITYNDYQTALEAAGVDGATAAGVKFTHLLTQLSLLPAAAATGGVALTLASEKVVGVLGRVGRVEVAKGAAPNTGNVCVYTSTCSSGATNYVGITNNLERRAAEHLRQRGLSVDAVPGLSNLSRADARAVEQVLLEKNGLGKNGGTLQNRINSIAGTNPAYADSLRRGVDLLRQVGYPGF